MKRDKIRRKLAKEIKAVKALDEVPPGGASAEWKAGVVEGLKWALLLLAEDER